MSETTRRPPLRVLTGAVAPTAELRPGPTLASVPPPRSAPSQQLEFEGFPARPDTLISLGLQGLSFSTFKSVIDRYGVRIVLDLRVSTSFRGSDFSIYRVLNLFESYQIHYRRLPSLVDRREDASLNENVRQRRYAAFLENQRDSLAEIRSLVLRGPTILLGWEIDHPRSDREIFADALQRSGTQPFPLIIEQESSLGRKESSSL